MNNKISVRQFAEKLASECGISTEDAQQYVKLYFDKVIECLRSGENVELPGLGKFSLTRQTDCPVVFEPNPDAAAEINSPFEMFEPTELAEGISETDLTESFIQDAEPSTTSVSSSADTGDVAEEPEISTPIHDEESTDAEELYEPEPTVEPIVETEPEPEQITEEEHDECSVMTESTVAVESPELTEPAEIKAEETEDDKYSAYIPEDEEEYVQHTQSNKKGSSFGLGFLIGILTGLIIGAVVLYVYVMCYVNTPIVGE